jgi:ATP-binding cassette subfamily F protein 3
MSQVGVDAVKKSFGGHDILNGVSFLLRPGDRTGLVGRNGCGKTTLLRIIKGITEPDSGTVTMPRDLSVGYLSQVHGDDRSGTLMEVMLSARPEVYELKDRLDNVAGELERHSSKGDSAYDRSLQDYAKLSDEFEQAGGYTYENEITGALIGLGFGREDFDRGAASLSGGERTRLELARLLIGKHGLLLLDEPTNHLDISSIDWLEDYVARYDGTILMVSHDRYFLDRITTGIVEIHNGVAHSYPGNFSRYRKLRAGRMEAMAKEYELARERHDKEKEYINRMRAGQNSRQAKGREKRLARFEMPDMPLSEKRGMSVGFGSNVERSVSTVLHAEGVTKSFAGRTILNGVDITVRRGERVAIIGANGTGKSTLIKVLMGEVKPDSGIVEIGGKVKTGYYSQGLELLDLESTVLDELWSITPMATEQEIRDRLGMFLFSGEDAEKKISSLSGGEKGRIAIAKIVATGSNLLVLDEPTNHLDIPSREALEEAIADFGGTIIAISHDRYFIDSFADKVYELADGKLTEYYGNYSYYISKKTAIAKSPEARETPSGKEEHEKRKREQAEKRRTENARKKQARKVGDIETEIEGIEARISEIEAELADPATYGRSGGIHGLTSEYDELRTRRDELYGLLEEELA